MVTPALAGGGARGREPWAGGQRGRNSADGPVPTTGPPPPMEGRVLAPSPLSQLPCGYQGVGGREGLHSGGSSAPSFSPSTPLGMNYSGWVINKDSGRHWGWGEKIRPCGPSFLTHMEVQLGMAVTWCPNLAMPWNRPAIQ